MRLRFLGVPICLVGASLAACSGGGAAGAPPANALVAAPSHESAQTIQTATAEHPPLATSITIDGLSYGLIGDGVTDNTSAFQRLLGEGDRTIHIAAGEYVTGRLVIPSRTVLILEPGVVIRDSGALASHDRVLNIYGEDVQIRGLGARVVSRREDYQTGEHRHGVFIWGARRVMIDGLESSDNGGDGFYVGGSIGDPAEDILLKGCRADNNRRQGLSVTSARRLHVVDCEFVNTNGTAPQFGVDLEPDHPDEVLSQIVFVRPYTSANLGGGILICLNNLNAASTPVDISIFDHSSGGERLHLDTMVPDGVRATLTYSRGP